MKSLVTMIANALALVSLNIYASNIVYCPKIANFTCDSVVCRLTKTSPTGIVGLGSGGVAIVPYEGPVNNMRLVLVTGSRYSGANYSAPATCIYAKKSPYDGKTFFLSAVSTPFYDIDQHSPFWVKSTLDNYAGNYSCPHNSLRPHTPIDPTKCPLLISARQGPKVKHKDS